MARARRVSGLHPRATLLENARAIVAVRVAEMFGFAHAVGDLAQDEDLHNMRIAAKRLRYTLEMFHVCLGPDGADLIDAVKEIQERIGMIHDADVLAALLRLRLAVVAQRQVEALAAAAFDRAVDNAGVPGADAEARGTNGEAQGTNAEARGHKSDAVAQQQDAGADARQSGAEEAAPARHIDPNDEERRAAAVRAVSRGDDARLGLAVLMARTAARRARLFDEFTVWWGEHGGDALRTRLDACLLDN